MSIDMLLKGLSLKPVNMKAISYLTVYPSQLVILKNLCNKHVNMYQKESGVNKGIAKKKESICNINFSRI